MPHNLGNLEKKDELYNPELDIPSSIEKPPKRLEIVPPPKREGSEEQSEELRNKEKAIAEHSKAAQNKTEYYETPKTIEQLGIELVATIDKIPEGENVDLKQVEHICGKVVDAIIKNDDKSPEKVKDEIIHFAETNFNDSNGSRGFVITELMRVADQKINRAVY